MLRLAIIALLFATPPPTTDPRIGSWTLVSAQSALTPPDQLSITSLKDAIHVVMSGETHLDFTARTDGHGTTVPANPAFNQVELHKIDKRQVEVRELKDGAVVATVRERLSNDKNELTVTTAASGHPDQITVWARTGGPKAMTDPLVGNWTQDSSKTRLRQGLVLKFEQDGSGATHLVGDTTYTARLDGKPYDVRNSRNDTVALDLLNPHTVDATFRRDNQVTQRDHWEVSADGQQMTVTSTALFETGQRLSEKLVFKRQ